MPFGIVAQPSRSESSIVDSQCAQHVGTVADLDEFRQTGTWGDAAIDEVAGTVRLQFFEDTRNGFDGDARPAELFFESISIADGHAVVGADIDEDTTTLVIK